MTRTNKQNRREGVSLFTLSMLYDNEDKARCYFEDRLWKDGRICGHCKSSATGLSKHPNQPYMCYSCGKRFSVRTGTLMRKSNLQYRTWLYALYIITTRGKGISSYHLAREIDVTQKTAWFLLHRLREAFIDSGELFDTPVEIDQTFFGGKQKNIHASKRVYKGTGPVGKQMLAGILERSTGRVIAKVISANRHRGIMKHVRDNVESPTRIYSDEFGGHLELQIDYKVKPVKHSSYAFVKQQAHTNGIESFWSLLKRAYQGTYHHLSNKHLQRYANEFCVRQTRRTNATAYNMGKVVSDMEGISLPWKELVA